MNFISETQLRTLKNSILTGEIDISDDEECSYWYEKIKDNRDQREVELLEFFENKNFYIDLLENFIRTYVGQFKDNVIIFHISYGELYRFWWDGYTIADWGGDSIPKEYEKFVDSSLMIPNPDIDFEFILDALGLAAIKRIERLKFEGCEWIKDHDLSGKAFALDGAKSELHSQKGHYISGILNELAYGEKTKDLNIKPPKYTTTNASEHDLEQYLKYGCKLVGWECEKQNPKSIGRGVPDRKITKPDGTEIYVELKSPQKTGSLSSDQIGFIKDLVKNGKDVRIIWSKEEVDEFLKESP